MSFWQAYSRRASQRARDCIPVVRLKRSTVELKVAILLTVAAQQKEAHKVSILRLSVQQGLLTHMMLDTIILSDDESVGAESETDYSSLDIDLTKSDSHSPHIADSDPVDGDSFSSRTTLVSDCLVADRQNDVVAYEARLQLTADHPRSASPGRGPSYNKPAPYG